MKVVECRTTHLMQQSLKLNTSETKATGSTKALSREWDTWDDY